MPANHSDVLIIGAGVIGLACAHYLAMTGRHVRVIDRETVGAGASHGNCGLVFTSDLPPLCQPGVLRREFFRLLQRTSPLYIKPELNCGRLLWFLRFAGKCNPAHLERAIRGRAQILKYSRMLFLDLMAEHRLGCDWETRGVLLVHSDERALARYARINALLEPYGLEAGFLDSRALVNREPALRDDLCGGWYHPVDAHLRPDRLMSAWKRLLCERGVLFQEHCTLKGLVGSAVRIEAARTSRGRFTADHYILATGAWSPAIASRLKLRLPIEPAKGYSITMQRPRLCPAIPCYFAERGVVATPWSSGYRLGGTLEFSGLNTTVEAARIVQLESAARLYLREPLGSPVQEKWVGIRPMCSDDLPIIDFAPGHRNLLIATGHGMMGVSMATGTGKLAADLLTGHPTDIDPAPFRLTRF